MSEKNVSEQVEEFFKDESPEDWKEEEVEEEDFFGHGEEEENEEEEESTEEVEEESSEETGESTETKEEETTKEASTEVEESEEEESELELLKKQNTILLERMEKFLDEGKEEEGKEKETETSAQETQTPTSTLQQNEDGTFDFVGDEDIDDIVSDKDRFNAVLNNAIKTALGSVQQIQQQLPSVARQQVQTQLQVNEYVREFYKENEDLAPVKKTVGFVANEVARENPEWELSKIFEETATRTRTMLGLKKGKRAETPGPSSEETSSSSRSRKPALPAGQKTGGKRGGKGPLTGQAKHINDVL